MMDPADYSVTKHCNTGLYLPIGPARLMPPSTPKLKIAMRNPRSWTCHMSATDAGIKASNGAMEKPWIVLAAANEPKLLTSAAQKHDTAKRSVVTR
jgi:hypothetical protein